MENIFIFLSNMYHLLELCYAAGPKNQWCRCFGSEERFDQGKNQGADVLVVNDDVE